MKRKRDKEAKDKEKTAQSEDDGASEGDWWNGWDPDDQEHQDTQLDDEYDEGDEEEWGWNTNDPSGASGDQWDEYAAWEEEEHEQRAAALKC